MDENRVATYATRSSRVSASRESRSKGSNHPKRPFQMSKAWKIAIALLIAALFIFALIYALLQMTQETPISLPQEEFYPPGNIHKIADQQLHIHVQGEGTQGPTILIESGEGSWSAEWQHIAAQLAEHYQVVIYDRAGYGYSSAPTTSREAQQIAQELKSLLELEQVEGPYFLVGHSLGVYYTHQFAQLYPDEVEGILFVEPRGNDLSSYLNYSAYDSVFAENKVSFLQQLLARFGEQQEDELPLFDHFYPAELRELTQSVHVREKLEQALALEKSELELLGGWSKEALSDKNPPLTILTTSRLPEYLLSTPMEEQERRTLDRLWKERQADFLHLSSQSSLVSIEDSSGHLLFEHADLLVQTILEQLQDIAARAALEALVGQLLEALYENNKEQFIALAEESSLYLFGTSFGEKIAELQEEELTRMVDFFDIYNLSPEMVDVSIDYAPDVSSVQLDTRVDDLPDLRFQFLWRQLEDEWRLERMEAHHIFGVSIASSVTSEGYVDATNHRFVETDTGVIQLDGYVGPEINFIYVGVESGDRHKLVEISTIEDKRVDQQIYLAGETGSYTIAIVESKLESRNWDGIEMYRFYVLESSYQVEEPYLRATHNVQSNHPEIVQLAERITSGITSDFNKAKAVNDWVSRNISYDVDVILADKQRSDTALETLQYREVDCEGYSRLYAALLRSIGIPVKIIVGHANNIPSVSGVDNHVWNEVLIDGQWMTVDPTWSAGYFDLFSGQYVTRPNREFFNPTAEQFALTHSKSSELLE